MEIKERIMREVSKEMKGVNFIISTADKINQEKKCGLVGDFGDVCPVVYLDDYVNDIDRGKISVMDAVHEIVEIFKRSNNDAYARQVCSACKDNFNDFNLQKISMQLIDPSQNEKLLEDIPHRKLEDLVIVYRSILSEENNSGGSMSSFLITNKHLEAWSKKEKDLFEKAIQYEKNQATAFSMNEACGYVNEQNNYLEHNEPIFLKEDSFIVVSNKRKIFGAISVIPEMEVLKNLAERLDSDFYCIPSSIHEFLIFLKTENYNLKDIKEMVYDINKTVVAKDEVLSYSIYSYERKHNRFTVAA